MSMARVYRGGTPADPGGAGGSPRDREPVGAAGATGSAGSAGGGGAHQPGRRGARGHRSTAHPPEPPVIVAHGRHISDTFDATICPTAAAGFHRVGRPRPDQLRRCPDARHHSDHSRGARLRLSSGPRGHQGLWKSGCGWRSSRRRVPKGCAPRRSPSPRWRRLRDGRVKRWPPPSAATPPANFLT